MATLVPGELQAVMRQLDDHLADAAARVPERRRCLIANALLNLAVERMLDQEGTAASAAILRRLAGLIAEGCRPAPDQAIPLGRIDA